MKRPHAVIGGRPYYQIEITQKRFGELQDEAALRGNDINISPDVVDWMFAGRRIEEGVGLDSVVIIVTTHPDKFLVP